MNGDPHAPEEPNNREGEADPGKHAVDDSGPNNPASGAGQYRATESKILRWIGTVFGSSSLNFWLATGTWVLAVIGGIGVYLTKDATDRSIKSASDDALKQRNIAVDTENRQLRAYVGYEGGETDVNQDGTYAAKVRLKNYGQTPAYHTVSWIYSAAQQSAPEESEFREPEDFYSIVSPGGTIDISYIPPGGRLPKDEVTAIIKGDINFYVWGLVRWEDIFKRKHSLRFVFRLDPAIVQRRKNQTVFALHAISTIEQ